MPESEEEDVEVCEPIDRTEGEGRKARSLSESEEEDVEVCEPINMGTVGGDVKWDQCWRARMGAPRFASRSTRKQKGGDVIRDQCSRVRRKRLKEPDAGQD